jgi:hypothetical protein
MLAAARVIPRRADFDGVALNEPACRKENVVVSKTFSPPDAPAQSAIGDRGNASNEPRRAAAGMGLDPFRDAERGDRHKADAVIKALASSASGASA